jgi:hypothetical protein
MKYVMLTLIFLVGLRPVSGVESITLKDQNIKIDQAQEESKEQKDENKDSKEKAKEERIKRSKQTLAAFGSEADSSMNLGQETH